MGLFKRLPATSFFLDRQEPPTIGDCSQQRMNTVDVHKIGDQSIGFCADNKIIQPMAGGGGVSHERPKYVTNDLHESFVVDD